MRRGTLGAALGYWVNREPSVVNPGKRASDLIHTWLATNALEPPPAVDSCDQP